MSLLPFEITPADAKAQAGLGRAVLIDVREVSEHQLTHIEGAELIPMNTIPQHLQHLESLAEEKLLIVFCHHGVRSLNVVHWLRQQGIENCVSMSGGIDHWSTRVDPEVPRY